MVYSTRCNICEIAKKRGKEAKKHECTHNYTGSSKSMEASATMKLTVDIYEKSDQKVF